MSFWAGNRQPDLATLCVCARASVRGKLLTQRATVTPTIPSVLYAVLVRSCSPYSES